MKNHFPLLIVAPATLAAVLGLNELARIHYEDCVPGACVMLEVAPKKIERWISEDQLDAVVATVIGEVRGVDRPDEVAAVVDVIWNRLETGAWGSTLTDVVKYNIKGRHAFSCWDKSDPSYPITSKPGVAREERYKRLRWVVQLHLQYRLQGLPVSLTKRATHYYHPASMKPSGAIPAWARKYTHTADIGGAKFYRATWLD